MQNQGQSGCGLSLGQSQSQSSFLMSPETGSGGRAASGAVLASLDKMHAAGRAG